MDNRTITFVLKMQNLAKATVAAFGNDLKSAAGNSKAASDAIKQTSKSAEDLSKAAKAAGEATSKAAQQARQANFKEAFDRGALAAKGMSSAVNMLRGLMVGLAAAASIKAGIDEYIRFERVISEFGAVADVSRSKLDQIRDAAISMAAGTTYSATDAAAAMTIFARAGTDVQGSMTAAKAALNGAAVAGIDVADMASIAISSLNAFGQTADKTSQIIDVLSKVDNISAAEMRGLGESFKYSAPLAAQAGVNINTLAAALGVLGDNGLKGSIAGTGFNNVINGIISQTNMAKKTIESLEKTSGKKIKLDATDLIGSLKSLREAGMNAEDAVTLFGREGANAALILSNQTEKIESFTKATQNAGGMAEETARKMKDNLGGDLETLLSTAKQVAIEIGRNGLGQALRELTQMLTEGAKKVQEFLVWLRTDDAKAFGAAMAVLAGAIGLVALALTGGIIPALVAATAAMFNFTMALLANPFTLIAVAIAACVAAIVYFGNKTYETNGKVVTGWTMLRAVWAGVVAYIKTGADTIADNFNKVVAGITAAASAAGSAVKLALSGDFAGAKAAAAKGLASLQIETKDAAKAAGDAYNKAFADVIAKAPPPKKKEGKPKVDTNTDFGQGTPTGRPKGTGDETAAGSKGSGAKETDQFANSLDRLIKQLMPAAQRVRELKENEALLQRGLKEGKLTQGQYAEALGVLRDRASDSSDAIGKALTKLGQERTVLSTNINDRDLLAQKMELENALRADGLAYLKNGVLVMTDDTRKRYESALAIQRQNQALTDQDRLNQTLAERNADTDREVAAVNMVGYAKERYLAVQERYSEALRQYHGDVALAIQDAQSLGRAMDDQRQATLRAAQNWQNGVVDGMQKWIEQARDLAGQTSSAISNALDGMSSTLSDFFTTGKLSVKDFVTSAIGDIVQLISRMLMLKAIQSTVGGSIFGVPIFHQGGMVGQAAAATRAVDPGVFAAAKRFHSGGLPGLARDEVPIIAQTGERILSREQNKAYEAGMVLGGLAASRGGSGDGGGGSSSFTYAGSSTVNLDGGGGGGSMSPEVANQLGKMLDDEVNKAMLRFIEKERRSGGLLAARNG